MRYYVWSAPLLVGPHYYYYYLYSLKGGRTAQRYCLGGPGKQTGVR